MINLFRCIPIVLLFWPPGSIAAPETSPVTSPALRLGTLNIAHGRMDAWNQLLVSGKQIGRNLVEIGEAIGELELHALALQEIDAPSRWTGRLDQSALLAAHAGFEHHFYGSHAASFLYDYGTALLSQVQLSNTYSHPFEPNPPTPTKGFVFGVVHWNPGNALPEPLQIGLISVHLDFSRQSVRQSQLDELISFLRTQDIPVILLGDFNLEAGTADAELERLAAVLELQLYQPDAQDQISYPGRGGARLDWILLPRSLRFAQHHTLTQPLSDHRLVWADIELAEPPPHRSDGDELGETQ